MDAVTSFVGCGGLIAPRLVIYLPGFLSTNLVRSVSAARLRCPPVCKVKMSLWIRLQPFRHATLDISTGASPQSPWPPSSRSGYD